MCIFQGVNWWHVIRRLGFEYSCMGGLTAQEQQQAASEAMGRALQPVGCLQGWFMETLRLSSAPCLSGVLQRPDFPRQRGGSEPRRGARPSAWLLLSGLGGW